MLSIILAVAFVLGIYIIIAGHNNHLKKCREGMYIKASSSCAREAVFLKRLAGKMHHVLDDQSLQGTEIQARIRRRWDGTIHELDDHKNAPAVSTGKQTIRLCLKGSPSEDAAFFVILHEMSHIACKSKGHTDEFWGIMRTLVRAAKRAGVYTNHDTEARVCGTEIGQIP